MKWEEVTAGEYEAQGEQYYYRVKRNKALDKWVLGRRTSPDRKIMIFGVFPTFDAAVERAENDG